VVFPISMARKALKRTVDDEDLGIGSLDVDMSPGGPMGPEAPRARPKDAPESLIAVGKKNISRHLTQPEIAKLGRANSAASFSALLDVLPNAKEMATVASAGQAKRGWYQRSAQAIADIYQEDAPRFSALLAATSPQTSVQSNLLNATNIFKNWSLAQSPSDPSLVKMMNVPGAAGLLRLRKKGSKISEDKARQEWRDKGGSDEAFDVGRFQLEIMGESVEGDKGIDSVLDAWVGNSVRALNTPLNRFDRFVISGPKVDSFMRNLVGNTTEVTNDTWMANYMGIPQESFSGSMNVARTDPGKGPGYLAANALTRNASEILSTRLGEIVTGPEIQEMVWSWSKAIVERSRSMGETPIELIRRGGLVDAMIADTPDFASLLRDPGLPYRKQIETAGYDPGVFMPEAKVKGNITQEIMESGDTRRRDLERAAKRLQRVKSDQVSLAALSPLVAVAIYEMSKRDRQKEKYGEGVAPLLKMSGGGDIDTNMLRSDGSKKSAEGFLGPIVSDVTGKVHTELSINFDDVLGGRDIPLLVPTLTEEEIDWFRNNNAEGNVGIVPQSIINKAIDHAIMRDKAGLDPFYQDGE